MRISSSTLLLHPVFSWTFLIGLGTAVQRFLGESEVSSLLHPSLISWRRGKFAALELQVQGRISMPETSH